MGFTKEQQLAIDADNKNIIVSAGAGSGKTAVLTERVIRKLKQGIDVNKLLILTFTNEAASEMKRRIRDKIVKNNLTNQLDLLDQAYITTFDSFALSLVKKYNYLLNVSDNVKITSENVILIKKYQIIDKIFLNKYDEDSFKKLINDFCLKDDRSIKNFVIEVANKLDLLVDKDGFINNYFLNFYSEEKLNEYVFEYLSLIKSKIARLNGLYQDFTSYINDSLAEKLATYFRPLFTGNKYSEYSLFMTMDCPKFMGVSEDGRELKDEIKELILEIKELLRFKDEAEMISKIKETSDYVRVILDICYDLDKEITKYKDKYDVYEFNDISHMAIKLVKDNLMVREELKNYFNEIMVDEYQDTSSIQETFINYIENNNVYMVGDIKQSIYRFRNANPYIFHDKYNRYQSSHEGIKIDLVKNFRSRRETLKNINQIFNLIMDNEIGDADYLSCHNMVYGNTDYDLEDTHVNNNLEIYNYEYDKDEEYTREEKELFIVSKDIIEKVKNKYQVFDKDTKKLRDIRYSDICIITDRNKYLADYRKILAYHGIPSVIYMDEVLTNDVYILVIKNLIDLVWHVKNNLYDDKFRYLYTSVARSYLFEYTDNLIYHKLIDKKYDDEIIDIASKIDVNLPISEVINEILSKYDVYNKLTKLANINENLIKINNLTQISIELSNLGYSILDFIDYLDDVSELSLDIKYSVNTSNDDAIKIMNIHKSKGLEFSLCYFTGMHNKFMIKEISNKNLFSNNLGIIMPYIDNGELKDTILKDIYKAHYLKDEISEKIRLFYVALTRCREKMIIVTSLDNNRAGYSKLVPNVVRLRYQTFLDILNSIKVIDNYVTSKEVNCNHDYQKIVLKELNDDKSDVIINKREIMIDYHKMANKHFSKQDIKLMDIQDIKKMTYGTKIHEQLEYANFRDSDNIYVKELLNKVDNDFINSYHEYEFSYEEDNVKYHGVIDLILEYDNMIYIIDYKLKGISDEAYLKQLTGYKHYIEKNTHKEVKTFLYSIINKELLEV